MCERCEQLEARVRELETNAEKEERAHLQTIGERDAAGEAASQMYYLITGSSPEWSNHFGYQDAINDVDDTQQALHCWGKAGDTAKAALLESQAYAARLREALDEACAVLFVVGMNDPVMDIDEVAAKAALVYKAVHKIFSIPSPTAALDAALEQARREERAAAWSRMGSIKDPLEPGFYVCNSIDWQRWEALMQACMDDPSLEGISPSGIAHHLRVEEAAPPLACERGLMINQNLPFGIGLHVDHELPAGTLEVWQDGKRLGRIENIGDRAARMVGEEGQDAPTGPHPIQDITEGFPDLPQADL